MTKQEILDKNLPDYNVYLTSHGTIGMFAAMDEYAKREAKEFYLWMFLHENLLRGYYSIEEKIEMGYTEYLKSKGGTK